MNKRNSIKKAAPEIFAQKGFYITSVKSISTKDDQQFYIDVNLQCSTSTSKVKYYKNVKELISNDEKESFITNLKYNTKLKALIFKEDGDYEKIKPLIKSLDSLWNSAEKILDTIKDIYPAFVFEKILQHINSLMSDSNRNRHSYVTIVNWLKYANQIPEQKDKTMELTTKLFNHKPNLPALKDEFRKAGII